MPSNYTGNPAGVQSPDTGAAPGHAPVISIPAGTDTRSIESITQIFKVAADYLAWILQVIGGTRSVKALAIDGTGGASATPGASHLFITGTAPSIGAGTGAGTTPTVSVDASSSDSRGIITVTTGTAPAASANICTLTFVAAYTGFGGFVYLTPWNANAAALNGTSQVHPGTTGTTMTLTSGSVALAATTTYQWTYFVVG